MIGLHSSDIDNDGCHDTEDEDIDGVEFLNDLMITDINLKADFRLSLSSRMLE